MKLGSNTVLITGGASGIGLALAERFLRAGSEVIVCGRREEKLREAKDKIADPVTQRTLDVLYFLYLEKQVESIGNISPNVLDETAHVLYYKPRTGEDMSTATVVAPNELLPLKNCTV